MVTMMGGQIVETPMSESAVATQEARSHLLRRSRRVLLLIVVDFQVHESGPSTRPIDNAGGRDPEAAPDEPESPGVLGISASVKTRQPAISVRSRLVGVQVCLEDPVDPMADFLEVGQRRVIDLEIFLADQLVDLLTDLVEVKSRQVLGVGRCRARVAVEDDVAVAQAV